MKICIAGFVRAAIAIGASAVLSSCGGGAAPRQTVQNAAPAIAAPRQAPASKKAAAKKEAPETMKEHVSEWVISKNNRFLVVGKQRRKGEHIEGRLEVWDARKRRKLKAWKTGLKIISLDVSPDNCTFISGDHTSDGTKARLWNLRTGKLLRTFDVPDELNPSVAFSASGRAVVVGTAGAIRVWSVKSGRLLRQTKGLIDGAPPFVDYLEVSPDGKSIVTLSGHEASVIAYDFKTLKVRWSVKGNDGAYMELSPDGRYVAYVLDDGIHIYKTRSGRFVRILGKTKGDDFPASTASFSADSESLIDDGGKNALRVWSVATGKLKRTLPGETLPNSPDRKIAVVFDKENKPQFRRVKIGK